VKSSLGRIACVLVLGAALLLPGCKKKNRAAQDGGGDGGAPAGNPILPRAGEYVQGGGAVQNTRRAVRRTADLNEFKQFALAYTQYETLNNRGPSGLDDVKDSLSPATIAAFKEGAYVAVWNVRGSSSDTVVAYVKDPDIYGTRIVATADGSARRMNQQEFDAAMNKK
jgi:hypothetical protein